VNVLKVVEALVGRLEITVESILETPAGVGEGLAPSTAVGHDMQRGRRRGALPSLSD